MRFCTQNSKPWTSRGIRGDCCPPNVNFSKDATRAKVMHGGHEAPEGGDFGIGFDEDRFATSGADSGRMHGKVVLGELFGD